MDSKRGWTVALAVTLFSGCATGSNTQVLAPGHAQARGKEGGLSALRRRDPMQAKRVPARVQPTGAPDERLARYFPAMDGQPNRPTTASPAGRPRLAPRPSDSPGARGAGWPVRDTGEEPVSTLPVSVTVGLRTPSLPRAAGGMPALAQRPRDAAVVPTSADMPAAGEHATSILPNDLSFPRAEDRTAPAARIAAKPVAPAIVPGPAPGPSGAKPETPVEAPRFVEPRFVVAAETDAAVPPTPPASPASERSDSATTSEPEPDLKLTVAVPAPVPAPKAADAPAVAEPPAKAAEPESSRIAQPVPPPSQPSESTPPPSPAVAAPVSPEPPSSPTERDSARPPAPTTAKVADPPAATRSAPPLPSKQMPQLSRQSTCDRTNPAPRPRLFASLWPTWLRPDPAPHAAAPRPALAARRPPTPRPALAGGPAPAPRSFLASLRPTWLRSRAADAPDRSRPAVAAVPPRQPAAPTSGTKPGGVTALVAKTVHGHGCSHHVCREGEVSPWFGANRALDTGVCYETMLRQPGAAAFAAPPAPTVASVAKPASPAASAPTVASVDRPVRSARPAPAVASNAKPVRPAPSPAVARIPTSSRMPATARALRLANPQRVGLITRLWNQLTGTVATVPATMTAPPPGVAPVYGRSVPSRGPVAGNLPKHGEPVERVSGERIDDAAQR